ncbi:hypothetical protein ACFLRB_05540 [Acidobacteriota bacterium]
MRKITGSRGRDEYSLVPGKGNACDSFDKMEICLLLNSLDYSLEHTYISTEETGYRLVVIHAGQVMTNKCYAELRHAKIAFARMNNRKGVKAEWTKPYIPCSEWWDKKINIFLQTESI